MLTLVLLLVSIDFEVGLCLLWYCCWYQSILRLAYVNFGIVVGASRS